VTRPLVSVTIPTLNSSKTIGDCLENIKNQSYPNIEIVIIDSHSLDNTVETANIYTDKIIDTHWKLLGSRFLGFQASKGDYVLLLDSDQMLYPDTIERLVAESDSYDMICLEEITYSPQTFLEKLFVADRNLINKLSDIHLDPREGVMLARFYKRSILAAAFNNIPIDKLHDVVALDHAIIYYEAYKMSSSVGFLRKAVMHKEPSSLLELWRKNYRYGKTTRELMTNNLYRDLLRKKTRFRRGTSYNYESMQSLFLLLLKAIPYCLGLHTRRALI